MTRRGRRHAGFTLLEAAITLAIFGGLAATFARTLVTSQGVSNESRAALRASEEHRRNLDAIANLLRGAALSSLVGFAADGTSTAPTFQRVTGLSSTGAPVLGAAEQLRWQPVAAANSGVASPGRLVVVQGGVVTVLAANVLSGGFRATLEGSTLKIALATYYTTSSRKTATVAGEVSVTLRN